VFYIFDSSSFALPDLTQFKAVKSACSFIIMSTMEDCREIGLNLGSKLENFMKDLENAVANHDCDKNELSNTYDRLYHRLCVFRYEIKLLDDFFDIRMMPAVYSDDAMRRLCEHVEDTFWRAYKMMKKLGFEKDFECNVGGGQWIQGIAKKLLGSCGTSEK